MIYINRTNNRTFYRTYGNEYVSALKIKILSSPSWSCIRRHMTNSHVKSIETKITWKFTYEFSYLGRMKNRLWYESGEFSSKLHRNL